MKIFAKRHFNLTRRFFSSSEPSLKIELPKWETVDLDGSKLPSVTTTNKSELIQYYRDLVNMRRMEIESDNLYKEKLIRGFCHLYIGQESIAVGMEAAITKQDAIITAYREHCQALARGDTTYKIIAEMMSKYTGSTKGKGGSMHYYSFKNQFYGGNGIVGAQIPLGTGIAFGMKYENKKNVCITMYGDGAANQGQLYEASNMAGLWKLPVIYCLENNQYGMGTSVDRASFYKPMMAKFRGFPALKLDGMNVFSVREGMKFCKEYAIANGPIFVEISTYRYQGHSMSDPGISYRTKDEVTSVRNNKDCISFVRKLITDNHYASEEELKIIDKEIKERIEAEVEQIRKDPYPPTEELVKEIYVGEQPPFIRGAEYQTSIHNSGKY